MTENSIPAVSKADAAIREALVKAANAKEEYSGAFLVLVKNNRDSLAIKDFFYAAFDRISAFTFLRALTIEVARVAESFGGAEE
jgi:hypothetical protein